MSRVKNAAQSPADQVAALRANISALAFERDALSRQRRSRAEVAALIEGTLSAWEREGCEMLARELQRAATGQAPEFMTLKGVVPVAKTAGVAGFSLNAGPLLVALLGAERTKAVLSASLPAVAEGLAHDARASRLAAIATELDDLEAEEERIIEAAGGLIDRRPDARPEIILAK